MSKKDKKIFNRCVGIVTITWTIKNGSVKTIYKTRCAVMIENLTTERKFKIIKFVKEAIEEFVLDHKKDYCIDDSSKLRFYTGFQALECEYFILPEHIQPNTENNEQNDKND